MAAECYETVLPAMNSCAFSGLSPRGSRIRGRRTYPVVVDVARSSWTGYCRSSESTFTTSRKFATSTLGRDAYSDILQAGRARALLEPPARVGVRRWTLPWQETPTARARPAPGLTRCPAERNGAPFASRNPTAGHALGRRSTLRQIESQARQQEKRGSFVKGSDRWREE